MSELFDDIQASVDGLHNRSYDIYDLNPTERYFFRLEFKNGPADIDTIIVARRVLKVDSVNNFRDAGGYMTHDGRQVKWGRIYRSAELSRLQPAGIRQLEKLNIGAVYDLRHNQEITEAPDILPINVKRYHVPIYNEEEEPGGFLSTILRHDLNSYWDDFNWEILAREKAAAYGQLFNLIAQQDKPMLIHCTAGKDRAGIAVALLLLLLGVPEETVVNDYTLSNIYFPEILQHAQERFNKHSPFVEILNMKAIDINPFFLAGRHTIEYVINNIKQSYGSIDNYFVEQVGVDNNTITTLRSKLLM